MTKNISQKHEYREAWRWPREVREWVLPRLHGETLNVCCGGSPIGDVRVDADPAHDPDVVADMASLPFPDNSFDSAVSDPPWKLNWFKRQTPFFELVRVVRPGGTIVYNCPWRPTSKRTVLVDKTDRYDTDWGQVSKLYEFRTTQHTLLSALAAGRDEDEVKA